MRAVSTRFLLFIIGGKRMADIKARLLLDAAGYEKALDSAKKTLQNFETEHKTANNLLNMSIGTLGKLAGGLGIAMSAQEAFDRIVRGSQTTSDEYDRIMRSVNSTLDNFFTALSTGDFTAFNAGIDTMIAKAREANDALDQLWNTTQSYNYFSAKNQANFAAQISLLRNKGISEAQREVAKQQAKQFLNDQEEITKELGRRSQEAIGKLVVEGNTLDASMITQDLVDKTLRLDVSNVGDQEKARLAARYKEYQKLYKKAMRENTVTTVQNTSAGAMSVTTTDYDKVRAAMKGVNAQYLDAITYNEVLVKKNDKWLEELIRISVEADNASRTLTEMRNNFNEATSSTIQTGTGGTAQKASAGSQELTPEQKQEIAVAKALEEQIGRERIEMRQKWMEQLAAVAEEQKETHIITEDEEGGDMDLTGLKTRAELYETAMQKIQEYDELMKVATDEEKAALEGQKSTWEEIADGIDGAYKKMKKLTAEEKKQQEEADKLQNVADGLGGLATGLESLGGVFQPISKAALMAEAVAVMIAKLKTCVTIWDYIAGIGAGMASIVSAFSSFAEGGIVGGHNYQDGITARVSSGEMIINEADQKRLYDSIHSGNLGGGGARTMISGEQLVTVINNYGRRTGRGEILK